MDKEDKKLLEILIFVCLLMVGLGVLFGFGIWGENNLSQNTMNDICSNFTQTDGVVGSVNNGKLICEVPSFDATQNIIIKANGDVNKGYG